MLAVAFNKEKALSADTVKLREVQLTELISQEHQTSYIQVIYVFSLCPLDLVTKCSSPLVISG